MTNNNWELVKLGDILNFKTGRLDSNAATLNGEYPFFTCSPETLSINSYAFDDEAVLLAGNNANGVFSVKYYIGKFNAYQRTYVITSKDRNLVSIRWLYFRIKHVTAELQKMSVGTATKFLTKKILDNFEIRLPTLIEQESIANILWSLQSQIDINIQINQTLESIAQAIFKSWFIDFDPVRAKIAAKLEGADPEIAAMCVISGKSEAELKKMPEDDFAELQATAALFPDELVESELGDLPRGWFKTDLSILADLNIQSWTKKNCPEKVNYVDLSNTKWGVIQKIEEFTFDNAPSRARRVLKIGDTIVGTVRPANGSYAFIQRESLTGSTGFAVLSPKYKNYAEFVYIVATDKENIKRLAHLADGGAYPAVSYDTVLTTPCILPIETKDRDRILALFHKNVNGFYSLLAAKTQENKYLVDTRDSLLPKLLSGELEVSDLQGEGIDG
ncbi:restriction endonuclease subunit S [Acinetobacter sp. TYF_19]|uniref:restriction endonuclease subunit S n=1 Tax=Acinetobacter sp. TYF_19 TaxID=3367196 RepID=UPI00370C5B67